MPGVTDVAPAPPPSAEPLKGSPRVEEKLKLVKQKTQQTRPEAADRSGWGCSAVEALGRAPGFDRHLLLSVVAVAGLGAVWYFGATRYLNLLRQDVYGGIRCASCNLRPVRAFVYAGCAAAAYVIVALGASDVLASMSHKWIFPVDMARPGGVLGRVRAVFAEPSLYSMFSHNVPAVC